MSPENLRLLKIRHYYYHFPNKKEVISISNQNLTSNSNAKQANDHNC